MSENIYSHIPVGMKKKEGFNKETIFIVFLLSDISCIIHFLALGMFSKCCVLEFAMAAKRK